MDESKTVFAPPADQNVIVYFEWEGPLGPHHFEGLWRNPQKNIVLLSDFRYEATATQFSGYWTMLLADSAQPGEWSLEARIDGEFAGSHSFIIGNGAGPSLSTNTRRVLSTAELYEQAQRASVFVEKLAADGTVLGRASGFFMSPDRLLTAFEAVDGASTIRLVLPDGSNQQVNQVLAWNRWHDWALLPGSGGRGVLKRAEANAQAVGERCFFLGATPEGARIITEGTVVGSATFPKAGERLYLAYRVDSIAAGSALLNVYGEFVGVVGGSIVPGASAGTSTTLQLTNQDRSSSAGGMAVPTWQLPVFAAEMPTVPLAELWQQNQFIAPISKSDAEANSGMLTSAMEKGTAGGPPWPSDSREVFSRQDVHASAFASWQPKTKQDGQVTLRIYDIENRQLAESKPRKLSLRPGRLSTISWDLPVETLPAGTYRADIVFQTKPVWRSFFRVTD